MIMGANIIFEAVMGKQLASEVFDVDAAVTEILRALAEAQSSAKD